MRLTKLTALSLVLCLVLAFTFGCAGLQQTTEPAKADWQYHDIVDVAFVQQYATMPQPKAHLKAEPQIRPEGGKVGLQQR